MSHRLISQLRSIRDEYLVARAALAFLTRQWPSLHDEPEILGQTFQSLHAAARNLEATYTVRLFAEFEALLRVQYPHSRPGSPVPRNSDGLISGIGARYRIPVEVRQRVHGVREFRHAIAHAAPGVEPVPFVDALSRLNQYLAYIPDADVPP
jgi:hypothetical protein